eukprot:4555203-Amphidinium_carterae.1
MDLSTCLKDELSTTTVVFVSSVKVDPRKCKGHKWVLGYPMGLHGGPIFDMWSSCPTFYSCLCAGKGLHLQRPTHASMLWNHVVEK